MNRSFARDLLAAAFVAACSSVTPGAALAQGAKPASVQREEFAAAQKLFDAKDFAGALPKFQELTASTGSPNARLYVARCLRELGRIAEAYDEMSATVRDATAKADAEAKYAPTRDAAAAELAVMGPKVGHLVIAVADAPAGSSVSLNGTPVAADKLGSPLTVAPGTQVVEVTPPGGAAVKREIAVGGGENKTLALALRDGGPAPTPGPKPVEAPAEPSGGGLRIAGFVAGGLGVASLAVFGITGAMSSSKFSSVEDACGGVRCSDPKYGDEIDSGKSLETIANITLIAGAALVAIAVPLVVFGGPSEAPSGDAAMTMVPGGGMLRVRGAF